MTETIPSVRGMRDVLFADASRLSHIESVFRLVLEAYSYEEIRTPIVEYEQLFKRGLGESTDAVAKEMYRFLDRDEKWLALRPEGTAAVVRAAIQKNLCYDDRPRLWYMGPMFRYERPQAGRYRQFQHVGAEILGLDDPLSDFELIQIVTDVCSELGISDCVQLHINSIGSSDARALYRNKLVDALQPVSHLLDSDSQTRLTMNPLRILDSKVPATQEILREAPKLMDSLSVESKKRFDKVLNLLEKANIRYKLDHRLVRGLDYYTDTVFEWIGMGVGAQDALCAGGRYDGLTTLLGGKPTPGVGFAAGIERIALLHEQLHEIERSSTDIYVVAMEESHQQYALEVAQLLRSRSDIRVRQHVGQGKIKTKLRWADRSGATWVLILGDNEQRDRTVTLKWLRTKRTQETIPLSDLLTTLYTKLEF